MNSSDRTIYRLYIVSRKKGYTNNKHIAEYLKISQTSVSECFENWRRMRGSKENTPFSIGGGTKGRKFFPITGLGIFVHVLKMEGKSIMNRRFVGACNRRGASGSSMPSEYPTIGLRVNHLKNMENKKAGPRPAFFIKRIQRVKLGKPENQPNNFYNREEGVKDEKEYGHWL